MMIYKIFNLLIIVLICLLINPIVWCVDYHIINGFSMTICTRDCKKVYVCDNRKEL